MGSINKRPLKAFVRFDGSGRVVSGSLVLRRNKPKVGNWQEIVAYECCNSTTTAKSYPAGQVSSASDAADACALTLDTVVYLKLATVEAPDGQDWNVVIGVNGVVTATNLCA